MRRSDAATQARPTGLYRRSRRYLNRANANGLTNRQDDSAFDTVVVARASLAGFTDELTVVAVVHPGDDVNDAKKLIAEEIANAVLH
jgi:hypothetical protein